MKVKGFLGVLAIASVSLLIACGGNNANSNANSNANNYNLGNINTGNLGNKASNVAGNVANATSNIASTITNKISNVAGNNSAPAANTTSSSGPVHGNKSSHIYHLPNCPDYGKIAKEHIVIFSSRADAERAGYRIAENCPGEEGQRTAHKTEPRNVNRNSESNKSATNKSGTQTETKVNGNTNRKSPARP